MLSVLVVEDDRALSCALRYYLTSVGFSVTTAESVLEATAVIRSEQIDCVLSDYYIEGGTARDVARVLRLCQPDVPILIVSGDDPAIDPGLPVTVRIKKPFDLYVVEHTIRRLCAQPA